MLGQRRWLRRLFVALLLALLALPGLLVGGLTWWSRHRPWTIPTDCRAGAYQEGGRGGLNLRYLGVSGYVIYDGQTTLVLDPGLTRPTAASLATGPLRPDAERSARLVPRADFILVNHAHYDHCVDLPDIARRTGAAVVGPPNALDLARSRGIAAARLVPAEPGAVLHLGSFRVDVRLARHPPIAGIERPAAGRIDPALARPLWFWEYRLDQSLSYRLVGGGATLWFHPTSTYEVGELSGLAAQTLIVGINGEPMTADKAAALLAECRPRLILPTHYDNFLQPYERGLALMPGLDLDAARAALMQRRGATRLVMLDYDEKLRIPPDP